MINVTSILLILAFGISIYLTIYTNRYKNNSKVHKYVFIFSVLLCFYILCMLSQNIFLDMNNINPVYFEYFTGLAAEFLPVIVLMISISYNNDAFDEKKYTWLYIFPVIALIGLWTNDLHKVFYINYSTNLNMSENGILFTLNAIYSYILIAITAFILLKKSYKYSGFFSPQTMLFIIGFSAPILVNILGAFKIISMSVYITPMLFSITAYCFAVAIIKLKALNITPITLKTIINSMSDAFVVISEDGTIADINKTFMDTFKDVTIVKDKDNFYKLIEETQIVDLEEVRKDILRTKEEGRLITKEYHIQKGDFDKYFEIDCQPIKAKSGNEYVAYLILIRDITAAKRDMEIMTKNENLVILGELAGGVAHDINTPISAIKSGLLMLKDTVNSDDERMLVARMDSCADKILNLVNSLRNQIRNIGGDEKTNIVISSIINDLKIILHNELTKSKIELNVDIKEDITLLGNSTKLSQVITNIVMNAIQAYEGKPGEIELNVYRTEKNEAIIRIEDHAGGIPASVKPYIFKNILTTKGVSGTGFGLYLAYSVIKGAFGGEILFDTKEGQGTIFYIIIPL